MAFEEGAPWAIMPYSTLSRAATSCSHLLWVAWKLSVAIWKESQLVADNPTCNCILIDLIYKLLSPDKPQAPNRKHTGGGYGGGVDTTLGNSGVCFPQNQPPWACCEGPYSTTTPRLLDTEMNVMCSLRCQQDKLLNKHVLP
uniref:Uncharacterized protein n=1 Tax=Sphaerodactylus townsendi TaxID=933632 RepID=A0ACB8FU17_9SAUR